MKLTNNLLSVGVRLHNIDWSAIITRIQVLWYGHVAHAASKITAKNQTHTKVTQQQLIANKAHALGMASLSASQLAVMNAHQMQDNEDDDWRFNENKEPMYKTSPLYSDYIGNKYHIFHNDD